MFNKSWPYGWGCRHRTSKAGTGFKPVAQTCSDLSFFGPLITYILTGPVNSPLRSQAQYFRWRGNAITYGLNSVNPVAGGESVADWEVFHDGYREALGPCGVPEEEIVRDMAMTKWRLRRVVRAESASIDALVDAIDDPTAYADSSDSSSTPKVELDPVQLAGGIRALQGLRSAEAGAEFIDPDWEAAASLITYLGAPLDEFPRGEAWTRASILHVVDIFAEVRQLTRKGFLEVALSVLALELFDRDQRVLCELAGTDRDTEARERRRQYQQQLALLPDAEMQERAQRAEAHLDRRYTKLASQLEQLQRKRSGVGMPPPVRLEVTAQ